MLLDLSRRLWPAAALLAGALTLASGALPGPRPGLPEDPTPHFAVPGAGMLIKGGEGQSDLRELLREFGSITGETFLYDEATAQVLSATHPGLSDDVQVAPEAMHAVLHSLLSQNRLALVDVRREEPRLLRVVALDSQAGRYVRRAARFVAQEELAGWAPYAALPVTTCIDLPNLDENLVQQYMRQLLVDTSQERITAVPQTRQVVLSGPADQVHEWARLLTEMDRGARSIQEARREAQGE